MGQLGAYFYRKLTLTVNLNKNGGQIKQKLKVRFFFLKEKEKEKGKILVTRELFTSKKKLSPLKKATSKYGSLYFDTRCFQK